MIQIQLRKFLAEIGELENPKIYFLSLIVTISIVSVPDYGTK